MAGRTATHVDDAAQSKTVATMIREAIERNGYKDVKECARSIKVPYDLFNKVVGGHIPKDTQLIDYARKLDIDSRELVLAAYREKAPEEMKRYFNSIVLLEDHNEVVQELLQLMDALNSDQLEHLLRVARMIHQMPRQHCRQSIALLALYQELNGDLKRHFDGLVQMALHNAPLESMPEFQATVTAAGNERGNRRGRSHA